MRAGRFIVWVVALALLLLALVQSGKTVALVALLACLLVPLVGWLAVAVARPKVSLEFSGPTSASKDKNIPLSLVLHNNSPIPLPCVQAQVLVKNLLTGQETLERLRIAAAPKETTHLQAQLSSTYCGRIEATVQKVQLFEVFRLFSVVCKQQVPQRRLSVMPTLYNLFLWQIYAAAPLSDTTMFSPYRKGADLSEVFALREYEEGDELKRIHWKLSEKMDGLVVREPSLPLDNSLLVMWDKGLFGASPSPARADAMAEVMLALCQRLADAGIAFEVASNDIVGNRCYRSFVTDENDMYELIGQLMSSPLAEAGETALEAYTHVFGPLNCSRLIYVGTAVPAGVEQLATNKELLFVICNDATGIQTTPFATEVYFEAGQAQSAIELLGVI